MSLITSTIILALLLGQSNYQEELKKDVVIFTDGKMILEGYGLVKGTAEDGSPTSLQVKYHSEAPASGVISRDNFVTISAMVYLPVFITIGEFKEIVEPIGKVDFEVNIYMNSSGLQIEAKNNLNNTANRYTTTWAEMYEE